MDTKELHCHLASTKTSGVLVTERGWRSKELRERAFFQNTPMVSVTQYYRNTLLEYGNKTWVVITIGEGSYFPGNSEVFPMDDGSYYKTLAYEAPYKRHVYDIDPSKEIEFESQYELLSYDDISAILADMNHDEVVSELSEKIKDN